YGKTNLAGGRSRRSGAVRVGWAIAYGAGTGRTRGAVFVAAAAFRRGDASFGSAVRSLLLPSGQRGQNAPLTRERAVWNHGLPCQRSEFHDVTSVGGRGNS